MRAHIVRSTAVLLFCLFCMPRPAHADLMSFLDWLDRLSGPGPWKGIVSEWNPGVWGPTKDAVAAAGSGTALKTFEFDPLGTKISQRDFHVRYGPQLGHLWAKDNNQDYGGATAPDARAVLFGGTLDAGLKGIEAGVAAGFVHFYGDGFGFTKGTFAPRVTVYPLTLVTRKYHSKKLEAVYIRYGWTRIIGDINASDFGAFERTPPQKMGDEWIRTLTIAVNPLAFIDR